MERVRGAGLLNDMVQSVHFVMPGTSMPMVVAGKIENSRSLDVQRHIPVLGQLIKKMTGVCSFIPATPVIRAAHIGTHANALIRPVVPLPVSIETHRNARWFHGARHTTEQQEREDGWSPHLFPTGGFRRAMVT